MIRSGARQGEETRTAPLGLRIKPSLKSALEQLAQAERRTLASYIEQVLEAHVENTVRRFAKKK